MRAAAVCAWTCACFALAAAADAVGTWSYLTRYAFEPLAAPAPADFAPTFSLEEKNSECDGGSRPREGMAGSAAECASLCVGKSWWFAFAKRAPGTDCDASGCACVCSSGGLEGPSARACEPTANSGFNLYAFSGDAPGQAAVLEALESNECEAKNGRVSIDDRDRFADLAIA